MEIFEQALVKYRMRLREILAGAGVASNPGVDDDWILDRIAALIPGPPPLTLEKIPTQYLRFIGEKYGWEVEVAREKVGRVYKLLQLRHLNDTITFLAWGYIPGCPLLLCEGCNSAEPLEHCCAGARLVIVEADKGIRHCQCLDCLLTKHLPTL